MDLSSSIIPKSDQMNADDLLAGPRTIKITSVESGSAEQPVNIHYDGENGRPYKPGKSMRRVLVSIWGKDSNAYIGQRLTLYNDTSITFGPEKTGGIRISHASGIEAAAELALTVKKGKRKGFRVEPLPPESAAPASTPEKPATEDQIKDLKGFYANEALTESIENALKHYKLTADEMAKLTTKQADVIIGKCRTKTAATS